MADFLLELLSEEIPARMQARARNDLAKMLADELGKAGLETGAVEVHSTPRRLVLIARDVATSPRLHPRRDFLGQQFKQEIRHQAACPCASSQAPHAAFARSRTRPI